MGLKIDAACLPYETKFLHQDPILWSCQSLRRINNMEAPLRCLIDSLYSSTFWGRNSWESFLVNENNMEAPHCCLVDTFILLPFGEAILGKVSWWMKHLKWNRVCPSKKQLWGAHQEGSCESGILSFPSFHTYHIKIKALLVSGSLVVNHAHWLQLLCPPCPWQWQAAMTSTPGDLFRS